jgi:hypothetical protein
MTREQLLDAIAYLLERGATCPTVAAAVLKTLSVAMLIVCLGSTAYAVPAPVFVPVPPKPGSFGVTLLYVSPCGSYAPQSERMPGERLNHAMNHRKTDHIRHAEERDRNFHHASDSRDVSDGFGEARSGFESTAMDSGGLLDGE